MLLENEVFLCSGFSKYLKQTLWNVYLHHFQGNLLNGLYISWASKAELMSLVGTLLDVHPWRYCASRQWSSGRILVHTGSMTSFRTSALKHKNLVGFFVCLLYVVLCSVMVFHITSNPSLLVLFPSPLLPTYFWLICLGLQNQMLRSVKSMCKIRGWEGPEKYLMN